MPYQRTEEAKARRKKLDHERYLKQRGLRLEKQRKYYLANREKCIKRVMDRILYLKSLC